jgi:enterochelin esterase family protein
MYPYNFQVDGIQVADPRNSAIFPNEGFQNSVVEIPGDIPLVHSIQNIPHGTISYRFYFSNELGIRPVVIYTPPGYEKDTKNQYPVLYLLHGGGGDEDAWATMGRACQILDNLIEKNLAVPMICVMPNGNPSQEAARTALLPEKALDRNAPGVANLYINSIVKDIIPYVEKNFRVIAKPEARAVSGLSMGGAHTLSVTNEYPGVFGYICPLSMGLRDTQTDIDARLQGVKKAGYKLYWIGCGSEDFVYEMAKSLDAALNRNGLEHTFHVTSGGHTWANWRVYLDTFAQLLFK